MKTYLVFKFQTFLKWIHCVFLMSWSLRLFLLSLWHTGFKEISLYLHGHFSLLHSHYERCSVWLLCPYKSLHYSAVWRCCTVHCFKKTDWLANGLQAFSFFVHLLLDEDLGSLISQMGFSETLRLTQINEVLRWDELSFIEGDVNDWGNNLCLLLKRYRLKKSLAIKADIWSITSLSNINTEEKWIHLAQRGHTEVCGKTAK